MTKSEKLEKFCYLKVKIEELSEEMQEIQEGILGWKDRPEKIDVPPYGTLSLVVRSNWKVLDIPGVFKKIGKDMFLGICSVAAGKLKKAVGEIGFQKLEKAEIIEKGKDTEYYSLKRNGVFKAK